MKTYYELCQYFQALAGDISGLASVVVGSDEDAIQQQGALVKYPMLRVDTPEIVFRNDDETSATRYTFRMFVLTNEPRKTNDEENKALSAMEVLAWRIVRRLWQDADEGDFDLIAGDKQGDAVRMWSADNVFGWWFTVNIELWTDDCA